MEDAFGKGHLQWNACRHCGPKLRSTSATKYFCVIFADTYCGTILYSTSSQRNSTRFSECCEIIEDLRPHFIGSSTITSLIVQSLPFLCSLFHHEWFSKSPAFCIDRLLWCRRRLVLATIYYQRNESLIFVKKFRILHFPACPNCRSTGQSFDDPKVDCFN